MAFVLKGYLFQQRKGNPPRFSVYKGSRGVDDLPREPEAVYVPQTPLDTVFSQPVKECQDA